jgi:paraquat-inducible protein A
MTSQSQPSSVVLAEDQPDRVIDFRQAHPTAKSLSLLLCHSCGRVNPAPIEQSSHAHCSRCHAPLHVRKTKSLDRTLALLLAATILYIPANMLPMTMTNSLLGSQQDTIMSGVIYFWHSGDYLVSTVIFMASIFIPMLKLMILAFLLIAVRQQSSAKWHFRPEQCAVLYRVVEFVGRWSMIDVFVVSLLAALIQMQSIATILVGPGAVAFGAVVVLTMLASLSFDPRIIWDNYDAHLSEQTDVQ